MDESEAVESLLTGTPVQKVQLRPSPRSSPRSTPRSSPGSSQKKRNRILKKLFCSSKDELTDDGISDEYLTASFPEKTWSSPLKSTPHKPMKTPGLVIPTPYVDKKDEDFAEFSTPFGPCSESEETDVAWQAVTRVLSLAHDNNESVSPAKEGTPPEKKTSSAHEIDTKITSNNEQDDDTAFLPDDIREDLIKQASVNDVHADNKENNNSSLQVKNPKLTHEVLTRNAPSDMISLADVQTHIDAAVREAQVKWKAHTLRELEEKHAAALEVIQQDAEKQLMEHGEQWNKEHEEELGQVKKEMESRLEQQRLVTEQVKLVAEAKWMETAKQERTEFLDKISVLVTKAEEESREHERRTNELRAEQTAKIERLETEVKEHQGALEQEKASLFEATQENKVLAERITTLEASVVTLEADKKLAQRAHEEAMQLLREEMESKLDLTRKQLSEASTIESEELLCKISELEADSTTLRLEHEERLMAISEAHKIELQKQQDEFQDWVEKERQAASSMQSIASAEKLEWVGKVETLETSLSNEREAHEQGRKVHAKQIEMVRKEKGDLEKELFELKDTLEAERKEWRTSLASKQVELQSHYEKTIQEMEERLEKQSQDFDKEKCEIMVMQRDASTKEKELSERLVSLEAQAHMDKEDYAKRLQQVRDQHTTEIDEMLAQLDLVEAEHKQKIEAKQESIKQKEAIIAALGAQLAESAAKTTALEAERQQDLARVEAARGEAEIARSASKSLHFSFDKLRDDHKKELEEERRMREDACQQVKKEMITAAEEQFGKANEHYVKLKHEYDSTMTKVGKIERELNSCKRELDSCRHEQAAREVELRAELAQLKAALATGEADSAKKANAYILEVEAMRTVHKDLQEKLEAATSESKYMRDSLTLVAAEKARLLKDNEEMKSVCEELMAIVEGGQ